MTFYDKCTEEVARRIQQKPLFHLLRNNMVDKQWLCRNRGNFGIESIKTAYRWEKESEKCEHFHNWLRGKGTEPIVGPRACISIIDAHKKSDTENNALKWHGDATDPQTMAYMSIKHYWRRRSSKIFYRLRFAPKGSSEMH